MKAVKFPLIVSHSGVSARVRKITKTRKGSAYTFFVVDYVLLGKRKQVWRASLEEAKLAASDACTAIANGEHLTLELKNEDRLAYLRATQALARIGVPIDTACREFADAHAVLGGRTTLVEAARYYVQMHNVQLPKVSVADAIKQMIAQARLDGKSPERIHQLEAYLNPFQRAINCNVTELTSRLISDYLVSMHVGERSKKNCRDVLAALLKWCTVRGYFPEDRDIMKHVQTYRNRRIGAIQIFTPEELVRLISATNTRLLPYITIQAFAGIRGREIQRLDWSDIDLTDGFIEIRSEAAKTDVRRLVPIKDNLKTWLLPLAQRSGPVCPFKNIANQLNDLAMAAGVEWRKNGLRHSYISYRVAECADVPRVADEAGNSPQVIRTNYLRRVKPAQAAAWFSIARGSTNTTILRLPSVAPLVSQAVDLSTKSTVERAA